MIAVYYLTFKCNFRCPYCSDGFGTPYYQMSSPEISPGHAFQILRSIRRYCENIVITGGEPLLYESLNTLLHNLNKLHFKCVVLTTNGYELKPHLPAIISTVDDLVFSIDTLDNEKADLIYGLGNGTLSRILENIYMAAKMFSKKITISSVVTPENIEDLYDVYAYSKKNRFCFAACPQLVGVLAHDALVSNPAYQQFFDFLIEEKKRGAFIFGTTLYLKFMRDLKKFDCRPFTMLVVSPEGNIYYPCLEKGKNAGNIIDIKTLHQARVDGLEQYGPQPSCGNQCHSACALSFSLILNHPGSVFDEIYRTAKGLIHTYIPSL